MRSFLALVGVLALVAAASAALTNSAVNRYVAGRVRGKESEIVGEVKDVANAGPAGGIGVAGA